MSGPTETVQEALQRREETGTHRYMKKTTEKVDMKIGNYPQETTVQLDHMRSRMGRATESHFAVLNTKIIARKQASRSFDPAKVLNPALRSIVKNDEDNKVDFLKAKQLFMGQEGKQGLSNAKQGTNTSASAQAKTHIVQVVKPIEIATVSTTIDSDAAQSRRK